MGPWENLKRPQSPEEVLRIKDQKVTALREKQPRLTRVYDVSEWFAVLLAGVVMQKAFPDQEPIETLSGVLRMIGTFGVMANVLVQDVPAPSQWPRVIRNLRESDWWNDKKDPRE